MKPNCQFCGEPFTPKMPNQKFCNKSCSYAYKYAEKKKKQIPIGELQLKREIIENPDEEQFDTSVLLNKKEVKKIPTWAKTVIVIESLTILGLVGFEVCKYLNLL